PFGSCDVVDCRDSTRERGFHGAQLAELTKMVWVATKTDERVDGKPGYECLGCDPGWVFPSHWVPSLNTEVKATTPERFSRRRKRQRAARGDNSAPAASQEATGQRAGINEAALNVEVAGAQQETDEQQECRFCGLRRAEMNRLLAENRKLREEMAERFLKDDVMVEYFTGPPRLALVMVVPSQILPRLPQTGRKLSPFQMLLLSLMHRRLNPPIQHIAHLLCTDRLTVSTTFPNTTETSHVRRHGNPVAVIVDSQTFSHYKDKHTLKCLIGITPQGAVALSSEGDMVLQIMVDTTERVIGSAHSKYTSLRGSIPLSMVLCALTNRCPSIVLKM
uniref:Uncharacterized protein n=1 Tax=Fundulus heteroclitus TaxID=8078 RepID=A0A3Q2U2Y9_FUNHE